MSTGFVSLSRNLMDEVLSWDPVLATQVGWHKYDSVLGDPSLEAYARRAERCQDLIEMLRATPASSLDQDDLLDRDLAIHVLRNRRFEFSELRLHERGCIACNTVGYSLFFLSSRQYPSVEQRMESIVARIESVPVFLQKARKSLRRPYKVWNQAAYEVGRELPSFFRSVGELVSSNTGDPDTLDRVRRGVKEASDVVEEHTAWLSKELIPAASDNVAVTPDEYERLLEVRGYGLTPHQVVEIGEAHLRHCRLAMESIARSVTETGSHLDAVQTMKSDHPANSEGVLREYRAAVTRSREFTLAKDLVTIPEDEELLVVETPEFMRPLFAYAGQFEPGKFDGDRTGLFLVTPVPEGSGMLREHSHAGIVNTAIHEGYPGHHLQGICANTNPSYVRVLSASPDFAEGWGLYAEQLMADHGMTGSTLGRLAVLNDLLYRIVRLIVEARLVMGTIDLDGAAKMIASECLADINAARIEARGCAMSPTYFSSYLLGKLALNQLREDLQKAMGSRFTLKFYHDSLLYAGCLPMSFMRRAVAMRLRDEHKIEFPPPSETLYDYALRVSRTGPA